MSNRLFDLLFKNISASLQLGHGQYLLKLGSEELWPRHGFMVSVHCGNMTLGKVHDTSLGHEELCEILLTPDGGIRSYGPDTK